MKNEVAGMARIVDERWKAKSYDHAAFADIAAICLCELEPKSFVSHEAVLEWAFREPELPKQFGNGNFGEPSITLFQNERFVIEIYYWLKPDISIHDHKFSGAFTVVTGNSFQNRYQFDIQERPGFGFLIGELKNGGDELLAEGDVVKIECGPEFIHQVWHLDRPTISFIIRSVDDPRIDRQMVYHHSHVGVHESVGALTPSLAKRLELMRLQFKLQDASWKASARALVLAQNPNVAMQVLRRIFAFSLDRGFVEECLADLARVYGKWIELLSEVFWFKFNGFDVSRVETRDDRMLLALLSTFDSREPIVSRLGRYFSGAKAESLVADWIRRLSASGVIQMQFSEFTLKAIEAAIAGGSVDDFKARLGSVPAGHAEKIEKLQSGIRQIDFLKSFFMSEAATSEAGPRAVANIA